MSDETDYTRGGKIKVTQRVNPETGATHINLDPGRNVFCDDCDGDWTDRPESGGIYGFGSKAICPECTPKWIKDAERYGELHHIKARCPEEMSFADWVRNVIRNA